ncbi:MAG: hypothetical protein KAR42_16255 [candidate division Zixibacteria bacterium]|nr:hypothetical protein [candidate division Zixibacteria bacterium]
MSDTDDLITSEVDQCIKTINDKLYGKRYCAHCKKLVPVLIYKIVNTDFVQMDGNVVTAGFTGNRSCSICLRLIKEE